MPEEVKAKIVEGLAAQALTRIDERLQKIRDAIISHDVKEAFIQVSSLHNMIGTALFGSLLLSKKTSPEEVVEVVSSYFQSAEADLLLGITKGLLTFQTERR